MACRVYIEHYEKLRQLIIGIQRSRLCEIGENSLTTLNIEPLVQVAKTASFPLSICLPTSKSLVETDLVRTVALVRLTVGQWMV